MKPNISLACKKYPCFPPVKAVLRQLTPRKIAPPPNPNPNSNDNPNLTLTGGQFSSGAIVRTPVKTKETKNRKEIKNNRRKKKV